MSLRSKMAVKKMAVKEMTGWSSVGKAWVFSMCTAKLLDNFNWVRFWSVSVSGKSQRQMVENM